jgi:hypothetical protein
MDQLNLSHAPPVRLAVAVEPTRARIHVLIRLVLLAGLGAIGCSSLYWLLYLMVPAMVALSVTQKSGAGYLAEEGPRLGRALAWIADAYAYLWLLTDRLPSSGQHTVELAVDPSGEPTPASALARLLYSLPAIIVLSLASVVGVFLWVLAAIWILFTGRMPDWIADFLQMVLAYRMRLYAYHLSLVGAYPSFAAPLIAHPA